MNEALVDKTYVEGAPDELWQALTTPDTTRSYFDFMAGFLAVESTWQPGAPVVYRTRAGEAAIEGEVLIADRPHRLATTLSLRYDEEVRADPPSRLTWEIVPMGEVSKLTVTHDETAGETRAAQDAAVCLPAVLANCKILLETGRPRLIKEIVVDCAVPSQAATFWAAALGYVMQGPPTTVQDAFVATVDPRGPGSEIGFQRVSEPKVAKNRVHLDLHATDRAAEVVRLLALGATEGPTYGDGDWTVMTDPEGNEFCIVAS